MKPLLLAVALLITAGPLSAQMVVTNDTLDAGRRDLRDALVILRDSLRTVQAAAAQFERGHASASTALLFSRGNTIKNACTRSLRNIEPTRKVVESARWDDAFRTSKQSELLEGMESLEKSLNGCEAVWDHLATTEHAEEIRTRGPREAESIAGDIRDYTTKVDGYMKALGIYVRPAGVSRTAVP